MTRDHPPPTAQRSSNQSAGPTHHHHHHKIVQFEPFHLLSHNDKLLKQAAELVESVSLSRFKVCVVSIVSKDSLDGSMQNQLVQSILNNKSDKRRHRGKQHSHHAPKLEETPSTKQNNINKSNELIYGYENQVIGRVDSKADVIVLNLSSFTEANQLYSLYETVNELCKNDEIEAQSLLSRVWPKWNQNLIKTLLILLTMSHIVVFYNPELCMDYNLIQIFKILETLRLKSQTRITDLLETIASKQMFPQNWIRQGRVSCPRALFVCDASRLDMSITQIDVINIKRDLEDQIYRILKKSNILTRSTSSNQGGLLSLPERDDFVFILTKHDPRSLVTSRIDDQGDLIGELQQREEFYSNLFRSLGLCHEDNGDNVTDRCEGEAKEKNQPLPSGDENQLSQDENELATNFQPIRVSPSVSKSTNLTVQQLRFRKFLNKHISDIQASQIDQDNKNNQLGKHTNLLLPRYDDFFTVLLRLKNLFFPNPFSNDQQAQQQVATTATTTTTTTTDATNTIPINWMIDEPPDERRFVDIFDLVNYDELFSKRHCHKTRLAAFDYYCRDLRAQTSCASPVTRRHHENVLDCYKRLYLNHARGSARVHNLDLLIDQCNLYWQNLSYSKPPIDEGGKDGRPFRNNRLCKTTSSDVVPSTHNSSQNTQNSKPSLSIARRANGVRVVTSCDCGRQSNFMITPVDRKKKLERVDIHRVND